MAQNQALNIQFFASGYCEAHEAVVNPYSGKGKCKFFAVWALVELAEIGYIVFDTGYSPEFNSATKHFPEILYKWMTPVTINPLHTAKSILNTLGIQAEAIQYVVISHFHADHIAGLKDFPNAKFICSKAAYAEVQALSGFKAVKKGIIHKLLPEDFHSRVNILEDFATSHTTNAFGIVEFQVFNSLDFKLILLPGHARGMLGFIFKTPQTAILYGTDASWRYETYSKKILPKKIVKLFFDSWQEYTQTLENIRAFEQANTEYTLLFTHCPKTLNYISNAI